MTIAPMILAAALLGGPMTGQAAGDSLAIHAGSAAGSTGPAGDGGTATGAAGAAAPAPFRGPNPFSEREARRRILGRGFKEVSVLHKDAGGIWRGTGNRAGASVQVWLDTKGNVGQAGGARPVAGSAATPPNVDSATAVTDGMAGNPPGTAARRAADLAVGTDTTEARPKGSPAAKAQ